MKIKVWSLAASALLSLFSMGSHAAIVGPVNVLSQVNNGTRPAVCVGGGLNASAGGVAEMALDLDQDGVADVCFGSQSASCGANFNYDALTLNTTKMMSTGGSIMNGTNATLAFWNGQAVGPFQGTTGSIGSANIGQPDVPMVFGFQGGSNSPATAVGFFSFTVKGQFCQGGYRSQLEHFHQCRRGRGCGSGGRHPGDLPDRFACDGLAPGVVRGDASASSTFLIGCLCSAAVLHRVH